MKDTKHGAIRSDAGGAELSPSKAATLFLDAALAQVRLLDDIRSAGSPDPDWLALVGGLLDRQIRPSDPVTMGRLYAISRRALGMGIDRDKALAEGLAIHAADVQESLRRHRSTDHGEPEEKAA